MTKKFALNVTPDIDKLSQLLPKPIVVALTKIIPSFWLKKDLNEGMLDPKGAMFLSATILQQTGGIEYLEDLAFVLGLLACASGYECGDFSFHSRSRAFFNGLGPDIITMFDCKSWLAIKSIPERSKLAGRVVMELVSVY